MYKKFLFSVAFILCLQSLPLNAAQESTSAQAFLMSIWAQVHELPQEESFKIIDLQFSPNDKYLAAIKHQGEQLKAQVWNTTDYSLCIDQPKIINVLFNSDNTSMTLFPATTDYPFQLWHFSEDRSPVKELISPSFWQEEFSRFQLSPDSKLVVASFDDGSVKVCDFKENKLLQTLPHAVRIHMIQFSPDSKLLATFSDKNNILTVWDVKQGTQKCSFECKPKRKLERIEFSSDGTYLMTVDAGELSYLGEAAVQIWNTNNGSCIQTVKAGSIENGHFSPDNKHFMVIYTDHVEGYPIDKGANFYIRFKDLGKRTERFDGETIEGNFNHDGRFIVLYNPMKSDVGVKIYDAGTGIQLDTVARDKVIQRAVLNNANDTLAIGYYVLKNNSSTVGIWKKGTAILKEMGYDPQQLTLDQAVDFYQWVVKEKKRPQDWKMPGQRADQTQGASGATGKSESSES